MAIPPILCVTGNSPGETTALLEGLTRVLSADGVKVGVVAASAKTDASLLDLATDSCGGCDLVLAQGHEHSPFDRVCGESENGDWLGAVCRACPHFHFPHFHCPHFHDIHAAADWVKQWLTRRLRLRQGVMGAILVGGQSRRMGADKAMMRVRDRRVLLHLAELLGGRLEDVCVIGRGVEGLALPRCVGWHLDLRPGCGPLGGIAAALHAAGAQGPRAVLAVACDMPLLDGEVLDLLLERRRRDRPASALRNEAAGQLEPLAAIYEPQALPQIEKALDAGSYSATALLRSAGAFEIPVGPDLAARLANVNTPEELGQIGRPANGEGM